DSNTAPVSVTYPAIRLTFGGSCTTSKPPISAQSEVGSSMPVSILMVVLLPAPFGPSKPTRWASGISRSIPWTATCGPNSFVRLRSLIIASFGVARRLRDLDVSCFKLRHQGAELRKRSQRFQIGIRHQGVFVFEAEIDRAIHP